MLCLWTSAEEKKTCFALWYGQTMRSGNPEEHEILCLKVCDILRAPNETMLMFWEFQGNFTWRSIGFLLMFLHCEMCFKGLQTSWRCNLYCIANKAIWHIKNVAKQLTSQLLILLEHELRCDINATRVCNKNSSANAKNSDFPSPVD